MIDRDDRLNDGALWLNYCFTQNYYLLKKNNKEIRQMNWLTKTDWTACSGKCHDDAALAEVATEGDAHAKR